MKDLLVKLNEISNKSTCSVSKECLTIALGWADCSIANYEFPMSTQDKELLSEMIHTAKRYENLWRNAVLANEIPSDCRVQKFRKSACEQGMCVLVGHKVKPDIPPQLEPNL